MVTRGYDRITQFLGDVATGKKRAFRFTHWQAAYAIAIAPDGSWLAVAGLDPKVHVWDVPTGTERAVFDGHHRAVYTVAVAPDGGWLATGDEDGTVRIWDMATMKQKAVLNGHRGAVYTVAITRDGRWLASGDGEGTMRIWETAHWEPQTLMRVEEAIFTCTWLRDGGLACAGPAGLYLFDWRGTSQLAIRESGHVA